VEKYRNTRATEGESIYLHLTCMWNMFYCTDIVLQLICCYLSSILKINLRETTVREIFKTQKSRDKLEVKKRRQKQQRINKTHRKLKVNEQPGHHKMGAWTRCTGRTLASSGGMTQHIGQQVHDSDHRTFKVMTLILNLHRPALKTYQCAYKKPLRNIASLQQISFRFVWCMIFICVVLS
jgi:hypothetical protein